MSHAVEIYYAKMNLLLYELQIRFISYETSPRRFLVLWYAQYKATPLHPAIHS